MMTASERKLSFKSFNSRCLKLYRYYVNASQLISHDQIVEFSKGEKMKNENGCCIRVSAK